MSKGKTLLNVEKAISDGVLWRAKEILQGNIGSSCGYDLDIYEKYGQVLLEMGDVFEAGRFLFLCGHREANYQESIELYLKRFSKKDLYVLYGTFPKAAKLSSIEGYPENVRKYLIECGYTDKLLEKYAPKAMSKKPATFLSKIKSAITTFIVLFILVVFLIGVTSAVVHGFKVMVEWIFH